MGNIITQKAKYKQSVIKFSYRHGVTKASRRFNEHRKTIYKWMKRYDGTIESLLDKSRRPHNSPKAHTEEEIKLIKDWKKRNKETGLVVFWVKLKRQGYKRGITSLYRVMCRIGIYEKTPSKRKEYEPKPYEEMKRPGERVQVDVKYVPKKCLTKEAREIGEEYFQYTTLDEYTRKRYTWFTREHNTYASAEFVRKLIKNFPFKIECIQTDNGFEFTNRLNRNNCDKQTLFEKELEKQGIEHKKIKPKTPRHNGKVERSHRKDQERLYYKRVFLSFKDLEEKGRLWLREYNNFPMKPLKWLTPEEKLLEYIENKGPKQAFVN